MPDLSRPERVSEALVAMLDAGDVTDVMSLYEDASLFVNVSGSTRESGILTAFQDLVDAGDTLRLNRSAVFETGDIALVHWAWTVTRGDGSTVDGVSAEVLRRQPNGDWKFVIDNSDGSAVVADTA